MRVLIAVMPLSSHLYPSVPLAWALQNAGHEVRVASNESLSPHITQAGLTAVSTGEVPDFVAAEHVTQERIQRITEALGLDPRESVMWGAVRHYVLAAFGRYYAGDPLSAGLQGQADRLVSFARTWRPDLVIWDPACLPAPIAARACGAAHTRLLWGQDPFAWLRSKLLARLADGSAGLGEDPLVEAMMPMLDRFGLTFDEEMLLGQWTINPLPAPMQLPADPCYVPMRWIPYNGGAELPRWMEEPPGRPRVALSLGLTTHRLFKNVDVPLSDLLEMVEDMDVELVATLDESQVAQLRRVPDNVRVVRYVPLSLLLGTCSAIIHHGGYGTFFAAAAQRVPQLIAMEEGGDALATSRHIERRGAGIALRPEDFSTAALKKQLQRILDEPSFRDGADALHTELLAAPSPAEIVPVLERLTAQHRT